LLYHASLYTSKFRTKDKLSNGTRSATREAAASHKTTDKDTAEAQLTKVVHGKAVRGKAVAALPCVRWVC